MVNSDEYEQQNDGDGAGEAAAPAASTESADSASSKTSDPEQFRKLFIGGLSVSTSDEGLRAFYSQWGEVVDCIVMRDPMSGKSRGFGFVSFAKPEEVDVCMNSRPHVIDGKTVDPKRALPREQSIKGEAVVSTKRLFVSGIREDHTEDMLAAHFSSFGTVEKAEIVADKDTGKPRGFAFVTFDDHDSVDKCVLQRSHMIAGHRCDVKKALSKEEMAQAAQKDRERMERGARSRGVARGGGWAGGRGAYGGGYGYGYGDGSQWSGYGGYYGGAAYGGGGGWDVQAGGQQYGAGGWQGGSQYGTSGQYAGTGTATEAVQAAAWSGGYGGSGGGAGGGGQYASSGGPAGAPPAQWNSAQGGGQRGY